MSTAPAISVEPLAAPTLEVVWQEDASAYAFTRDADGALSSSTLQLGRPAVADLALVGSGVEARRLDVAGLLRLVDAPPAELVLGGSAQVLFAVVELARRSVAEGLVHPDLDQGDGWWFAFWGATLDATVQKTLTQIAAALPEVGAAAFGGDRHATVLDLYQVAVYRIARDRLRAARVQLSGSTRQSRPSALELFLDGLSAPEAVLPRHSGYAALERRLSRWVDTGLGRPSAAPWKLGLRLDERGSGLVLEPWLQAGDDPTLGLPASLLWQGGADVFAFVRASNPQRDLIRQLGEIEPVLADAGIELDAVEPTEV
ncbi:MAG: hypothetical protein ACR2MU_03225, partial [Gaiellaceae bacterium]